MRLTPKLVSLLSSVLMLASVSLQAADATKGKEIYEKKCTMCHAKNLKGNPAMAKVFKLDQSALDLTSKATQDKKDAELIAITTKGKGKMPAQEGKLSSDDIANAVAYLRSAAGGK